MSTNGVSESGDGGGPAPPGTADPAPFGEAAEAGVYRLRYQELFDFAPDCQLVTDRHGVILEANHAAAALFRSPKEFLIGKPLGLLAGDGLRNRFYECLLRRMQDGRADEFETRMNRKGEQRDVAVRAASADLGATRPVLFRWLIRDVTELNRAQAMRDDLLRRLVSAQEEERRRVSRELHDHLGQEVMVLILGLKSLEDYVPEDSPGRKRLHILQDAVDRIGQEAHELAVDLRPLALDDLGLSAALAILVQRWSSRTGLPVDYHYALPDAGRFRPEAETTVYRVVQESLTNIAKHAGAGRVSVIVEQIDGNVVVIVEDDGRGFDEEAAALDPRLGLLGMQERAVLVGGSCHVESSVGAGTTVRVRIPVRETEEGRDRG